MSSSSSDEYKKMKSMLGDDDEIKATREKLMLDFHKDVGKQLVTSRVGLCPILGNHGSQITGSAGNIGGHSSVERSMRSGGELSVPCLTSRLNLNTNSGFGNLSSARNIGSGSSIGRSKRARGDSSSKALKSDLFAEALCKVRGEIDVEFRDEANAADPYKINIENPRRVEEEVGKIIQKRLKGTTKFYDFEGNANGYYVVVANAEKEVPPTANEVDAMKKNGEHCGYCDLIDLWNAVSSEIWI
nr:transcription regulator NOT2/NOT3/NOT5-like protein [Tanacetum cinerariifolium]